MTAASSPRITVAVVSYNHARYVEQCMTSLLGQTVPCSIIMVDDNSADDTQSVIRRVVDESGRPDRFTLLLHQENIGLPAGLNAALRLTSTEYFVYLAGDDWSLPDRAERQLAALDAAGGSAGLSYTDCLRARADGTFHPQRFSEIHADVWRADSDDPYRDLLMIGNWIPAPTVMFRTSALRAIGGFDERIAYEDHDSYVRIARDYRLVHLPEALSVHRELDDCLGAQIFFADSRRWLEGLLRTELKQLGHRADLDAQLAERLRVRAIELYKLGGDNQLAATALARTFRTRRRLDPKGVVFWLLARREIAWLRVRGRGMATTAPLR